MAFFVPPTPAANRLLAALPGKDRRRFLGGCEPIELSAAQVLAEPGEQIRDVYFPTQSCISLALPVEGHAKLGVALVGNEGMLGISLILGGSISLLHALVQERGPALRMDAERFRAELELNPALRAGLERYLDVLMRQLAQTAACTRFHLVEARLARWLLMTQDRAQSSEFHVTQEFLAYMLGVRRVGVTKAAMSLQIRDFIRYRRGNVTILDRDGLKSVCCSCYATDKIIYARMMGARIAPRA